MHVAPLVRTCLTIDPKKRPFVPKTTLSVLKIARSVPKNRFPSFPPLPFLVPNQSFSVQNKPFSVRTAGFLVRP
jgi:hypothetical protein